MASQFYQLRDCLLNRLFRLSSKKTSKLRVTGLSPVTGEFPAQKSSNAEDEIIYPFLNFNGATVKV